MDAGSSTSPPTAAAPSTQLTGIADGDSIVAAGSTIAGVADNGTTQAMSGGFGSVNSPVATNNNNNTSPNKRLQNPLGNFSSSTYTLTLYMITPSAYDAFVLSNRTNLGTISSVEGGNSGGAYVLAQSGGTNNTSQKRAPGFELDFYIDDLKILSETNAKATSTSSNLSSMTFTITEPTGFSFISRLAQAASNLRDAEDNAAGKRKVKNFDANVNATRQFFILGVSFCGYDVAGNVVTTTNDITSSNGSEESRVIADRFYDILITEMKFKIDGKVSKYYIRAANIATQTAYSMKHGRVPHDITLVATTVEEALAGQGDTGMGPGNPGTGVVGLFSTLNSEQQEKVGKSISIANVYKIRYLDAALKSIAKASILSPADLTKSKLSMSTASTSSAVNESTSVKATVTPTQRNIAIKNDTSIMQAISTIITQSTYLTDALTLLEKSTAEAKNGTVNQTLTLSNSNYIKWYNLSSEVKCLGWDDKIVDFAYEITYVIQTYETPAAISLYSGKSTPYYGPVKRYAYWFTGQNAEVLGYEQVMDNLYYNIALGNAGSNSNYPSTPIIPVKPDAQLDSDKSGTLGSGSATRQSYVTNLSDPGALVTAKLSILGDPDFLVIESPGSINALYNKFYGTDGYTINANGGQVFIEIDFKELQDYDNTSGLMTINESISFWKYPPALAAVIQGVSYMVLSVNSSFLNGKFTQVLNLTQSVIASDPILDSKGERPISSLPGTSPAMQGGFGSGIPQTPVNTSTTTPVTNRTRTVPVKSTVKSAVVQDDDAVYNAAEAARVAKLNLLARSDNSGGREIVQVPVLRSGGINIGNINSLTLLPKQ